MFHAVFFIYIRLIELHVGAEHQARIYATNNLV